MNQACTLPLSREQAAALAAGDRVSLSGVLYTARDAAHKRFANLLDRGEALPFPIEGACIYYAGPAPAKDGQVIGSAGPTTSCRMDAYTPRLLKLGLRCMIGKGDRSEAVITAMKKAGAVYFAALGGAGALLASRITSSEMAAFPDLGTEAVRRLTVSGFPVVVAIDSSGGNLYKLGPERYLKPS
ncbi:MAG: Fe-S-containing hydro-lyase [Treponema sp.]|nr:Fe-S-containing hydro-lyase [Treponema sp.]